MAFADIIDQFHLAFGNNKRKVEQVVEFCHRLTIAFEDRLPDYLRSNMPVWTGWWAISLYVQLPLAIRPERLKETDVDYACSLAADHLTLRLTGPTSIDTTEIRDAFPAVLHLHWTLWNSAFGYPPDHEKLQDFDAMSARLREMFDDEELDLRDSFSIPERDHPMYDDEDEEEPLADAGDELSDAYALFFDICSRSRP